MIDINKEAEEYAKIEDKTLKMCCINDFIAGHNSKATQAKVIQGQIDELSYVKTQCYIIRQFKAVLLLENRIKLLHQQLKELEE
jgi:hypothetical protein